MHRRTFLGLVLAGPAVAAVGLPVVTPAAAQPRPVGAVVAQLALRGVVGPVPPALRRPGTRLLHQNAPTATAPFSLVGVTWDGAPGLEVDVQVRTRAGGRWSAWQTLPVQPEHRPDAGEPAVGRLREGTAAVWVGPSDGVQVRLGVGAGATPLQARVQLVDPGSSAADRGTPLPRATAGAAEPRPELVTRVQWGADESVRRGTPDYTSTVRVGFVHHTASSNAYTPEQAAAMVRGIYAYHVVSRGWSDIGYNFLVDRFGRAYEGRAGGADRFVLGAHTGGFNRDSFGVALLGDFGTTAPSERTLQVLARLLAWKLGSAFRDPGGRAVLTSAGGGTSRFAAGTEVAFDVVSGHRDAGGTSCPGQTTYDRLPALRRAVSSALGTGFADPVVNRTAFPQGSPGPLTVAARTVGSFAWTATVLDERGVELHRVTGGDRDAGLSWDLTGVDGRPAAPGRYAVRLTGGPGSDPALTYSAQVVIDAPTCGVGPRRSTRPTPKARAVCGAQARAALPTAPG